MMTNHAKISPWQCYLYGMFLGMSNERIFSALMSKYLTEKGHLPTTKNKTCPWNHKTELT